jgi:hypothetical protein
MIRLLMAGLLLVSVNAVAATQVTHTFKDGDVIKAEEFNKNFDDLEAAIDNIPAGATAEGDVALTSTAGDVDITGGEVTLSSPANFVSATLDGSGIILTTNNGTAELIKVTNSQGTSDAAIALTSTAGGITLSAANGIKLNSGDGVTADGNVTAAGNVTANTFVNSSDARLKEAVSSVGVGLGLINDLNPVRYHRINNPESDIEMGLMAQEVEATLAKHGLGNSGMVVQPDDKGYLYLRYNDLLAPMIKAIQELDDASEAKDEQIASLQQKLESQQEELLAIVQSQQEQIAQLQKLVEHQFVMN